MRNVSKYSRRDIVRAGIGAVGVATTGSLGMPAIARAATMLRFVATGAFPPYNMRGDDGRITGIYADMLGMIGKALDISIDYRPYPWPRAQKMVEDGEADGFVTIPTEARRQYARFVPAPLVSTESPLLVTVKGAKNAPTLKAATSLEDLKKFRIGDYRGNSYGDSLHKDWADKHVVADLPNVLKILVGGRIDYTVQIQEIVQYYAKIDSIADRLDYTPLNFLAKDIQNFHIGIRSSFPDNARLISDIGREQERLRAEGVLGKVIQSYVN